MHKIIFIFIGLLLAVFFTIPKLYKMSQIKGYIPGAKSTYEHITQKWHQKNHAYWISWTKNDIKQVGNHRINMEKEEWDKIQIGDKIEIIRINDDNKAYLKNGIFASTGNFIFDIILLSGELFMVIIFFPGAIKFIKTRQQS